MNIYNNVEQENEKFNRTQKIVSDFGKHIRNIIGGRMNKKFFERLKKFKITAQSSIVERAFKFFDYTGIKYLFMFPILFLIINLDKTRLVRDFLILDFNLYEILILILLGAYLFKYYPRSKRIKNFSDNKEYQNIISVVREITWSFSLLLFVGILINHFKINKVYHDLFITIVFIRFYFSVMMILTGSSLLKFLLQILMITIGVYTISVFDIKWWALITGGLAIWLYINSIDFVIFLRKGKDIESKYISDKVKYIWQRNKLRGYLLTFLLYASLLISSLFEKNNMVASERLNIRMPILMIISFLVAILIAINSFIINRKRKNKTTIVKMRKLPKWKKLIAMYLILQKK